MREILIATKNEGKVRELSRMLEGLPYRLRNLSEFPEIPTPEETGETFYDNARLKAKYYGFATGLVCIADDSGMEVTALNNEPGVLSARFAGENSTDEEKSRLILERLVGQDDRSARFVCVLYLFDPVGGIGRAFSGICEGFISEEPRGKSGFGYDPIFEPDGYSKTMAELGSVIKNTISHRFKALVKLVRFLSLE